MPETLAPGVYIEETSFRSRSIEGVSTSTAGFAGPARRGPTAGAALITSLSELERAFGGPGELFGSPNHLWLAARAFFENGGGRLYVARAFQASAGGAEDRPEATLASGATRVGVVRARTPGSGGRGIVVFTRTETQVADNLLDAVPSGELLRVTHTSATPQHSYFERDPSATGGWRPKSPATATWAPPGPQDRCHRLDLWVGSVDADGEAAPTLSWRRLRSGVALTAAEALEVQVELNLESGSGLFELLGSLNLLGARGEARVRLSGGGDGAEPGAAAYQEALAALARVEAISVVATPGATERAEADAIQAALLTHVEARRSYRMALLDTAPTLEVQGALDARARVDSSRAAMYYPWVVVPNPVTGADARSVATPPSGFLAGIYARNDAERGIHKAPANEVLRGALGLANDVSTPENELLNPAGVNALRFFAGRGLRVWGARTTSSDSEWRYVNVRRYFNYLEASLDRGTQWAVFEPNGEALWANVRDTVSSFLYAEWRAGALLGSTEKEAYFVRCDRSTMTQSDLDNGRLVCLIGVAVVKPAEFVILRVGQKTSTSQG